MGHHITHRNALERRPSRIFPLTKDQQLDIRAHQRTYQGAYIRTCIGVLSFSVLVMKLFSREFASMGVVFQVYALILCIVGYRRGKDLDLYFVDFQGRWWKEWQWDQNGNGEVDNCYYFKTSGDFVLLLYLLTTACLITLVALLARL
ncbi:hypothetical protein DAMA08_043540 [Martiniozyma asiatica (nom. inval.)]|nr:hypothetical protein DAMA08_043540 [Martiniozyma asiatica]